MKEGAISAKFVKIKRFQSQDSLMSMSSVLTWKPSDEHPQRKKAKARIVILGTPASRSCRVESVQSPTLLRLGKMLSLE